jgi:periplasmic copper chaperone A
MSVLLRCLAAVVAFSPAVAFAHVTLENRQAEANSTYKAVLRIPHGCGEQTTLKIRIQIPEGVVAVKPMPKAGWALDLVKGPYSTAYKIPGGTVKEGIKEIVWSGSLPDAHYDEFVFQARITDVFQPGSTVHFPTVQECANGAERWVEIPAPGQEAHALKYPAPSLRIAAAAAAAPASFKAGPLVVEAPWSRATPGGAKVGAGYMRIVNRGSEPDRLIAGTAEVAGKFELHETSTADGVARMRPVEGGLLIKPGEPVELKPGGLHAMLVDLARPLKEGETIRGTLVFEKAGTVAIEYRVGGIGAQSASGGHHH